MTNPKFVFIGASSLPKATSKTPFVREIVKRDPRTGKDRKMLSLSFGLKSGDNMVYLEAFDGEQEKVTTYNENNEKITIPWEERTNNAIKVAGWTLYIVDLGPAFGGRHEFLTRYDLISYLRENLPRYAGRLMITGQLNRQWYAEKQRYTDRFQIRNVFAVDESQKYKDRLSLQMDIYYNKDCVDLADLEKGKKAYINGYIEQYINKEEGIKYVPMTFVFSSAMYDLENNPHHKELYEYKLSYVNVDKKKMRHLLWDVVLLNGAEEVPFNESMLTPEQRRQVELGLHEVEDFRPRGTIYGDKVSEYRLKSPCLIGDFQSGFLPADETEEEFEMKIYQPPKNESFAEAKANSQTQKAAVTAEEEKKEISKESLFGDDDLFY